MNLAAMVPFVGLVVLWWEPTKANRAIWSHEPEGFSRTQGRLFNISKGGVPMRRKTICVCALLTLASGTTLAQRPESLDASGRTKSESRIAVGELQPTPEMWFYEQYQRQQDDPSTAVRAKAEFRAAQRQGRLAAMRWFGLSNSRPHASSDPFNGDYSPKWTANNVHYPSRWMGRVVPSVVVRSEESRAR